MAHVDPDAIGASAFALSETLAPHRGPWHQHQRHQLLYARSGTLRLEVDGAAWQLPPQRAAWIGGGVPHRVSLKSPAELCTLYLAPALAPWSTTPCRVFSVHRLAREMLLHSARWGPETDPDDPLAQAWFAAVAGLAEEWSAEVLPVALPAAQSEALARAMDWTLEHLADAPTVGAAAKAAGLSPRSLARRFREETGGTWQGYLRAARVMRAIELLVVGEMSVTEVAFAVGYKSLGTFSRTFSERCGVNPSELLGGA